MMQKNLKKISKHSIIYGLGSLINKVLSMVLLPIYTRNLSPADFGVLALITITAGIIGTIIQMGLGSAMFREVIYKEEKLRTVESTTLYYMIVEGSIITGVMLLLSPSLSLLIFNTVDYTNLFRLSFITVFLSIFNIIILARLRIREQSLFYSTLTLTRFLVGLVLNVYFIVVLQLGLTGLFIANLILEAFYAIIYLFFLLREIQLVFPIPILKRMLKFGLPLVPTNIASQFLTSADRYFLQYYSTTTQVGLYSLGYNISSIMGLIVQAIQLAWPANMFEIAKQQDAKQQFSRILTYYIYTVGFIGLGLSVLAIEVLVILATPQYYAAASVVPLITLSYIFYGARFMTNTGLDIRSKNQYAMYVILVIALVNLGLNFLLIPPYGIIGAAWATAISYFLLVFIQTAINQYFWYIPYEYPRIIKIAFTWAVLYFTSSLVHSPNIWINLCIKIVLLAIYPFLLLLIGFYTRNEISFINQVALQRLKFMIVGRRQ